MTLFYVIIPLPLIFSPMLTRANNLGQIIAPYFNLTQVDIQRIEMDDGTISMGIIFETLIIEQSQIRNLWIYVSGIFNIVFKTCKFRVEYADEPRTVTIASHPLSTKEEFNIYEMCLDICDALNISVTHKQMPNDKITGMHITTCFTREDKIMPYWREAIFGMFLIFHETSKPVIV